MTQGPYYLDLDKIRRDVTEGKSGLRLDLRIKVVNASTCKALEDVAVEIWHADAGGTYSGFSQEGTAGKTYLRGVQLTGENGVAQFQNDLPAGWYQGRAIHIHMKVHVGGAPRAAPTRAGRPSTRASCSSTTRSATGSFGCRRTAGAAARACATARTASTTRPAPALSSACGGARRARSARG